MISGMSEVPGLRERKNERTRIAIERAAAELALEQGYDHTTVDQIAARADVAPRTVYVRYPTKEAILFSGAGMSSMRELLAQPDGDVVDGLTAFVQARVAAGHAAAPEDMNVERLKIRAIWTDPFLRRVLRGKLEDLEAAIATQLSSELGLPADDSGVAVFAAAVTGLFVTMAARAVDHPETFDPLSDCARGLLFLRAGLDELKRDAAAGR
jgi:AcrR family transcriptional regulator